jgi:cellulose synthase/poly-beta-1,6-N-acetylglucosamine synthase-like glycosyltransferase
MECRDKTLHVSIGICAYNEEGNMRDLLAMILDQKNYKARIEEVIIISSGSNDGTEGIVKEFSDKDSRIKLLVQKDRLGKASAVNVFLKSAGNDICILINGDAMPEAGSFDEIVKPFDDPSVGITGSHSVPLKKGNNYVSHLVDSIWRLHHSISLRDPKISEMIGFRKDAIGYIPGNVINDDAYMEMSAQEKGYSKKYVSKARVFIETPGDIGDFIKQRRRIAVGHIWNKVNFNYVPSTQKVISTAGLVIKDFLQDPKEMLFTLSAIFLEITARILASYDYYIRRKNPYIW